MPSNPSRTVVVSGDTTPGFSSVRSVLETAARQLMAGAKGELATPGCNGPWHDRMTPARLCSHRIMLLAWYHQNISPDPRALQVIEHLAGLVAAWRDPKTGLYINRQEGGKSRTNGLVGQAWVLEGLATHHALTKSAASRHHAQQVIAATPFDARAGLWSDPGTRPGSRPASTLNQQVFFAAVLSEHARALGVDCEATLERFYATLPRYLLKNDAGYWAHLIKDLPAPTRKTAWQSTKASVTSWLVRARIRQTNGRKRFPPLSAIGLQGLLAEGYHSFIFFGLARAGHRLPADLAATLAGELQLRCAAEQTPWAGNPFALHYNHPLWELYAAVALTGGTAKAQDLLEEEVLSNLRTLFRWEDHRLICTSKVDPHTLTARLYELCFATGLPRNIS